MHTYLISQYYTDVEKIIHYGGSTKETAIRNAFAHLINLYAEGKGLRLVPEISLRTPQGNIVTPDGTLKDALRLDWGYWESKDESDDLETEIRKKFDKCYPKDNILFEDSKTAILIQNGQEVMRCTIADMPALDALLQAFVSFERLEVRTFREAIEAFKQDVPKVTQALRELIRNQQDNPAFVRARDAFLKLCQDSINPDVSAEEVQEMMIQHILTEDIFNRVFDETQFHRENNIARELEKVVQTFFTGPTRRNTLDAIKHFYEVINAAAAGIADHHEKQKFLKVVYEAFYKAYNPKGADRLGIVYTPNEIVRFMIQSTDYLLHRHFNRSLNDAGVEIMDPATGTGTFICDLIDYLRKDKLEYKYRNEIHANEIAILPYYIANLNIEYTFKQKMDKYLEFESLCLVDTLDNMGFTFVGKQLDMFAPMTEENSKRIKRQNSRKISVIIGNPPYNANQQNENENNKNREYPEIDRRIKDSFIKHSTAQKTKVYDMYARFYRWAFDRLDANGVVAFITNRSFIDSRTFDGFRKCIQDEFDHAYIIDTRSDVRANPKIAGTTHNVFGIQTGVAILFLIRKESKTKRLPNSCRIEYTGLEDTWRKEEKLQWLNDHALQNIDFERIRPDKNNNWLNITDNDWEELLPLADKAVKQGKGKKALFGTFSNGVNTARDSWVYDLNENYLRAKIRFFEEIFHSSIQSGIPNLKIKWSRDLKLKMERKMQLNSKEVNFLPGSYRPFFKQIIAADRILIDVSSSNIEYFSFSNKAICLNQNGLSNYCLATGFIPDWHFTGDTLCIPFSRNDGEIGNNLTDWGHSQFTKYYKDRKITKEDIFHYVYAVLHNPVYRETYAQNLKRDFPRIPLYENFRQWTAWGKTLMDLHLGYETATPWGLEVKHDEWTRDRTPAPKLKADKELGIIYLDEQTRLRGIPAQAWTYQLGNRSALEWILDQYKEKTPKDPTIREKFNTYRFADYKTQVIDLLDRVTRVSVETMQVVEAMRKLMEEK